MVRRWFMLLLGHAWRDFELPEHEVEVWAGERYWHWRCTCGRHEGYGSELGVKQAGARHVEASQAT